MAQNASPQAQNGLKTIVSVSQMVQHHFWKHIIFARFVTHFWSENGPFSKHFGIFHGPKRVTTGLKGAKNTRLSIPNGPTSVLEKRGFDPCWTHFWSQSVPFSRHLEIFHGPKRVTTGSEWPKNNCFSIPNGPTSLLETHIFARFLTHFWSENSPFSRLFGIFHGPKRVTTCSKWAKNTCLSIPNGPTSLVEKRVFDPFFTHFWSENSPFSRHFGIFHAPKRVTTGSKWAENTCLSIPNGPTSLLEKPVLDPFVTHHFGIFHGPQRVTMGSKWAKNTCLGIPNGPTSLLEQRVFDPFLVPKRPIFKPFWDFPWPKTRHHGLQMG